MTRILGVDGGSRWCGASAVEPGHLIATGTHDVNPGKLPTEDIDVAPTVAWIIGCALWSSAERIVVEHSKKWAMWRGMDPAQAMASQANWAVCDRIVRELQRVSPVPVETMHAQSWRSRVVPALPKDMPPEAKPRMDARVTAVLPKFFHAEDLKRLATVCPPCTSAVHQRDAAGVAIGHILGPKDYVRVRASRKSKYVSKASPRTLAMRAQDAAVDALLDAGLARVAAEAEVRPVAYSGRR